MWNYQFLGNMMGLPFKMIGVLLHLPRMELPFKMTPYFPKLDLKFKPFAENLKSELLGGIIALFVLGLTYLYYRMKTPKVLLFCGMAAKSKILVLGGTGYIGKFIVKASAEAGNPTFALVRESTVSHPEKSKLIESFKSSGVTILYGDLSDHESLVKAIKQVDVVISTLGGQQIDDQVKLIAAIKEAGNIKRFLPSEFGLDVERHNAVEPVTSFLEKKVKIRRSIEAEGIPYTYICSNAFAGYFLPTLGQQNVTAPPRDKVVILGDGNVKAIYVKEEDIGTYTIKAVDDPRTLNKILYVRPPANILTFNELVSLWENKIKNTLEKVYIPEDQLLKYIQESPFPANLMLALAHSMHVKGDCTNYEIDPSLGVEASNLYPEVKYTTVDNYLNAFNLYFVFVLSFATSLSWVLLESSFNVTVLLLFVCVLLFCAMAAKSKILVIGGTGYIGKFIVKASAETGHPTFVLVRDNTLSHPEKSKLVESFKSFGVTLLYGDLTDHNSLVKAIKQVDVVISALGGQQIDDQVKIIAAIKEAGNIKRFLPSEFGLDVDHHNAVEPVSSFFEKKVKIRRAIEAERIPYTYISSNLFAGHFLPNLLQQNVTTPPRDKVVILGDGNVKGVYVIEEDVATYTIKAVEDPRTLNKTVYVRPPANILTFNELVSLWEYKINSTLDKIYIPDDQLLKSIQESPFPDNFMLALRHSFLVKGDCNYEIDPSFGVEASKLYSELLCGMAAKSKILVLGGTGYIGKFIVKASAEAGHPTFALVRETTLSHPEKSKLIESFKSSGVTLLYGDVNDHESLVKAIKQVDVVISTLGGQQIDDQVKVIAAIKEAGNIKRFFPSEFGLDVDRHDSVDPVREVFVEKARIRRIIEAEGIPYTYLCCHAFTGYFLRNLAQIDITVPPRDKVFILGDGNVKGAFVTEADVGTLTIEAANDPNALNKTVHIRLPKNYLTINEIISLWEKKIGKTLEKTYVSEEKVLNDIKEASFPNNYLLALYHSQQIKGDAVYKIDPAKDLEASEAYPNVEYTTVDEYLNHLKTQCLFRLVSSMAPKDRILVLGPTGAIGRHIVWASVKAGNPTFILVRDTPASVNKPRLVTAANPETREELIQSFQNSGVTLIQGDMNDHESLVNAIKQVDVVICSFGRLLIEDQVKIVAAIKEAGNVKRFFPSEFGLDVDRHDAAEPVREVFEEKAKIRRVIEAEGIPYTYLCCHAFTGYFLRNLAQIDITVPPRDKVFIQGDGNVKGAYITEADVGTFTIEAANDPRALNKAVHIRLPNNYLSLNDIISLWEKKIGKTLEKIYVSEEEVLKQIKETSFPNNYLLALYHSQQIKGDAVYEIDPAKDLEASEAYPHVEYSTVSEYLDHLVPFHGREKQDTPRLPWSGKAPLLILQNQTLLRASKVQELLYSMFVSFNKKKRVYVTEEYIGTNTIKAVDDPRTLNKILYLKPPANVLTFNELISLWESKIQKALEKTYVPEDQIIKSIQVENRNLILVKMKSRKQEIKPNIFSEFKSFENENNFQKMKTENENANQIPLNFSTNVHLQRIPNHAQSL
ncbi:Isoflavone reductase [Glycine max]|nr:Isoflavone reductase [Glycine max]